ncbi:MAG: hypothetical protein QNL24_02880 [Akkermansiaceae bacterium]|jgi:hypothetical protein
MKSTLILSLDIFTLLSCGSSPSEGISSKDSRPTEPYIKKA